MKLELRGITKRFPGVVANDNVNLSLNTGEVLSLIGENGAGKSTLMSVLYGMYKPDEGEIVIDGTPLVFTSPADAIAAGIGMVHQHFMLVPVFTVAENVVLGVEPTGALGKLNIDEARRMVREISDKYNLDLDPDAVIEDCKVVGEADPRTATESQIAEMMVGRPVQLTVDKKSATAGDVVLKVTDLTVLDADGRTHVENVSFEVHAGEIVGIAGVQGNGQTELVEALTGLRKAASGVIALDGKDLTHSDPRERHQMGMAHIPEDRQRQGLVGGLSVAENLVLTRYHDDQFSHGVIVDWEAADAIAETLISEYDIRTPNKETGVGTLSGGNQQKVIVARELSRDLRLTIAAQPTRGVDVGSIEYIHSRIVKERDAGTAVLIVSTELEEVMALSDRLLVMYRGKVVAELDPKKATPMEVGLYMAGSRPDSAVSA